MHLNIIGVLQLQNMYYTNLILFFGVKSNKIPPVIGLNHSGVLGLGTPNIH